MNREINKGTDDYPDLLLHAINFVSEGIIYQYADGKVAFFNRVAERVFGLTEQSVTGHSGTLVKWKCYREDGKIFPNKELPSALTLKTGKSCEGVIIKIVRNDGAYSWIKQNTHPVYDEKNNIIKAVVITFTEITLEKETENEIKKQLINERKLAETSAKLLECKTEVEAYNLVGSYVYENEKNNIILVCDFDYPNSCLFISKIFGLNYSLDAVSKILSIDPMCVRLYIDDIEPDDLIEFKSKKLFHVKDGLYTIAGKRINRAFCKSVEKLLGIRKVHVMGFTWDGKLYGGLVVLQTEMELVNVPFIEALVNQTSSVLNQKQKEKKLSDSEERYRLVMDTSMDAILITGPDNGKTYSANKAACRMFNMTEEELCEAGRAAVVDPQDPRLIPLIEKRNKEGYASGVITMIKKGGIKFQGEITSTVYRNSNNELRASVIIRDVTERILAQKTIAASEEKFRLIAENSGDNITVTDLNLNITYISPNISKIRGYSAEEAIGHTLEDIFTPDSLQKVHATFQEQMHLEKTGTADPKRNITLELEETHKNGTTVWVEANFSFMRDADMKAIGVIAISRDITEKKLIQQALQQSEEKYRLLAENAYDVIWVLNIQQNRFTYVSPSIYYLRGLTVEEAMRETIEEALTPESYSMVMNILNERLETFLKDPTSVDRQVYEIRQPCKNGDIIWVEASAQYKLNEAGEIEIIGVSRNINERKLAEQRLNENEKKYRELFEFNRAGIIIFLLKEGFPVMEINEAACKIGGYEKASLISENPLLKEKGLSEELTRQRVQIIKDKGFISVETVVFGKNGKEIPVRIDSQLINYYGEPAVQSAIVDISDIKQAEAEAKQRATDYMEIFNSTHDAIFIHDAETGLITDVNKATCEMYGYPSREVLLGCNVGELSSETHPYTNDTAEAIIKKTFNEGPQKVEWLSRKKDGTLFWVEVALSRTSIGGTDRVLAVVRDITERKEAESRIINAKNEAQEQNRLKSAFLANMSHDMRTPLNAILGFSKIIAEESKENNAQKEYLGIIESSGKQLLTIINDLIDITKIEANQLQTRKEEVCINEVILELYLQTKTLNQNNNIQIKYMLGLSDEDSVVYTDNTRLRQVLNNLIGNALKFTEKGTITIGYQESGDFIEFFVEDSGKGIAKDDQQIIFERYKQLGTSSEVSKRGFGLGLAITKSLIELLGGKIRVESELGKGTRFVFTIPFYSFENAGKHKGETQTDYSFDNLTILIAEDEWVNFVYLKELLITAGFSVLYAENGFDAVKMVRDNPEVNLVLTDIKMPVMDGYAAAAEIRKFRPEIPIIFQTAFALENEKQKVLGLGYQDILFKPINANDLYKCLSEALKKEE